MSFEILKFHILFKIDNIFSKKRLWYIFPVLCCWHVQQGGCIIVTRQENNCLFESRAMTTRILWRLLPKTINHLLLKVMIRNHFIDHSSPALAYCKQIICVFPNLALLKQICFRVTPWRKSFPKFGVRSPMKTFISWGWWWDSRLMPSNQDWVRIVAWPEHRKGGTHPPCIAGTGGGPDTTDWYSRGFCQYQTLPFCISIVNVLSLYLFVCEQNVDSQFLVQLRGNYWF